MQTGFNCLCLSNELWLIIRPGPFSFKIKEDMIQLKVCAVLRGFVWMWSKVLMISILCLLWLISNSLTSSLCHGFNKRHPSPVDLIKMFTIFCNTTIWSNISFWCETENFIETWLYRSNSHHYLISCVPSSSQSRLFFFFPFPLVACLMSHSCSWQWLTLATLPHCPRVVNLFMLTSRGQCYLSQRAISSNSAAYQEWAAMYGNRSSIQTHHCSGLSETLIPVYQPTTCAHMK